MHKLIIFRMNTIIRDVFIDYTKHYMTPGKFMMKYLANFWTKFFHSNFLHFHQRKNYKIHIKYVTKRWERSIPLGHFHQIIKIYNGSFRRYHLWNGTSKMVIHFQLFFLVDGNHHNWIRSVLFCFTVNKYSDLN